MTCIILFFFVFPASNIVPYRTYYIIFGYKVPQALFFFSFFLVFIEFVTILLLFLFFSFLFFWQQGMWDLGSLTRD